MIVFLSATSLALIMNAVIAWFAYKAIANMSARATESMDSIRRSGAAREWVKSLDTYARRAAEVTTTAKVEIISFEPSLIRAEKSLARALEKVDSSCDTACGAVTKTMDTAGKVASRGYWIVDRLCSGFQSAFSFVRAVRDR